MRQPIIFISLILISVLQLTGCASSTQKVFGHDMPTMKAIHDEKFQKTDISEFDKPLRLAEVESNDRKHAVRWLPNPTLTLYVFPHLSGAGHPVPGYETYFKLYTQHHIALPSERGVEKP